jgi:hypothetical protein
MVGLFIKRTETESNLFESSSTLFVSGYVRLIAINSSHLAKLKKSTTKGVTTFIASSLQTDVIVHVTFTTSHMTLISIKYGLTRDFLRTVIKVVVIKHFLTKNTTKVVDLILLNTKASK